MIITNVSTNLCKPLVLVIGRQLEDNYRQFVFNCSEFGVEVASITLVHQRKGDAAPYIVTSVVGSDTLTWTVSATDTAFNGYGKAELRIVFTDGLAKSAVYTTCVLESITADTVIPSALQSWYDAMIAYIDEHSVSPEELAQAIEDYIAQHPIQAPVQSVNTMTGDVVITAADLGALTVELDPVFSASAAAGITSADITAWNGKYTKPSGGVPVSDLNSTAQSRLMPTGGTTGQVLAKKTNSNYDLEWVNQSGGGGAVDSVNGKTGTVVLDASDVGALPDNTTIDDVYWCTYGTTTSAQIETALTAGKIPMVKYQDYVYTLRFRNSATNHRFVCNYGGKEKSVVCQSGTWMPNGDLTFLTTSYTPPVTSVNSKTGAVTLTASDVGAMADNYTPPVYYGVCSTAASTQNKEVTISGITALTTGLRIMVLMQNASNAGGPRLNVNGLGAVDIMETSSTSARLYEWSAGSLLDFTYDGSHWILTRGTVATTTYYGVTKLYGGYNSSDNGLAATAGALKSAYDTLNNAKASTAVATTLANGLMSATDKANLDAVYADYSSAINALGVE